MLRHSIEQKGISIITEANTEALVGVDGHVTQNSLEDGTVLEVDLGGFCSWYPSEHGTCTKCEDCAVTVVYW